MSVACSSCEADAPAGQRFCGTCGGPLDEHDGAPAGRLVVTAPVPPPEDRLYRCVTCGRVGSQPQTCIRCTSVVELIPTTDRYEQGAPRRICKTCAWSTTAQFCVNCGESIDPDSNGALIPLVRAQQLGACFEATGLRRPIHPAMLEMLDLAVNEYVIVSANTGSAPPKGLRTWVGHRTGRQKTPFQGLN